MTVEPVLPALERLPGLPSAAWLYHRDSAGASILAGPGVEAFQNGIFEGCWSGPFEQAGFAGAPNVFGTGLTVGPGGARFVTPTQPQRDLVAWIGRDSVTVANSLAFLLEFRGITLPYADWGRRFCALIKGIDADYQNLWQTDEGRLVRVTYDDFEICDGELRTFRPDPGPEFPDFATYRDYLRDTLRLAFANGRDPARRRPLRTVGTASSGYDSLASAALAAEFGLDAIVTLKQDRDGQHDSGEEGAAGLGCRTVARSFERGSATQSAEAEFIATGSGGEDLQFSVFADEFADAMVVTGCRGDTLWGMYRDPSATFLRGDRSGSSFSEFFLRIGATAVPVPMISARRSRDIRRISLSAEMAPWRIGGGYDRPIARRIAEDAGVRREVFGQQKRTTSQLVFRSGAYLSPASRRDFFSREREIVGADWLGYHAARLVHELRMAIYKRGTRALSAGPWGNTIPRLFERLTVGDCSLFEHEHPRYSNALFLWAIEHQRRRYREALAGRGPSRWVRATGSTAAAQGPAATSTSAGR